MSDAAPTPERLLEAALSLVVEDGVQAVTHRTVEERAGVARGSTRYWFGSRDDFLAALIAHLADRDRALLGLPDDAGAGEGDHPLQAPGGGTPHDIVAGFARLLMSDRDAALARYELYLYAARRPALAEVLERWSQTFIDLGAAMLGGGPGDQERAALLSATLDGLVLHALAAPHRGRDQAAPDWFARVALEEFPTGPKANSPVGQPASAADPRRAN